MRLFHNPMSSNSRRVTLAAEELGIPLDVVLVDLMSQADRKRLGEINPNSKIPVLEDGDILLWESCAIMQYLADSTPGQTLYPQDIRTRADINRWMFWACQHFSPAIGVLTWEHLWKGMVGMGPADPAEVARGERDVTTFGAVLDAHLAQRQWLVGEALSLADLAVAAPIMYMERAHVPLGQFPHLMRWFGHIAQRDSWHTTVLI